MVLSVKEAGVRGKSAFVLCGIVLAGCMVPPSKDREKGTEVLRRADRDFLFGNYSMASFTYERYLAENPSSDRRSVAWYRVGRCRLGEGKWSAAIEAFKRALAENPDGVLRLQIDEGMARGYDQGLQFQEARRRLEMIEASPRDLRDRALQRDEFLFFFGVNLLRCADWKRGREVLSRLVTEHPKSEWAERARLRLELSAFAVQIGFYAESANAQARFEAATRQGLQPSISTVALPGRSVSVITVGRFANWLEAHRESERLRGLGFSDAVAVP